MFITTKEIRRWHKMMRGKSVEEQQTMMRMYEEIKSQSVSAPTEPDTSKYGKLEEMVVVGRLFDSYSLDPAEYSIQDILEMRGIRRIAD